MRVSVASSRVGLLITATIILVAGCGPLAPVGRFYGNFTAYYNTYYNAKKYFKQAEKTYRLNRRQHTNPETQPPIPVESYQRVIEAGANMLEFYSNSRWIDDTLILMGKSYFRLQEYSRAERKFSELITIFPDSEHRAEAGIWRAQSMIAQNQSEQAEKALLVLLPELKRSRDLADAHLALARIYSESEKWSDAAEHYEQAAAGLRYSADRMEAYFALGQARFEQQEYESAQVAFYQIISRSRNPQQVFDASIYWSRCAVQLGEYEGAEQILYSLKTDPAFFDLQSAIDIEIAGLAVATGRVDEGIQLYRNYIERDELGEERGLAYFKLGEIYRDTKVDLATARANFDSVDAAGASPMISDSARAESQKLSRGLLAIERLQSLQDSVSMLSAEQDSLQSLDLNNLRPSQPETPSVDSTIVSNDAASIDTVAMPDQDTLPIEQDLTTEQSDTTQLEQADLIVVSDTTAVSDTTSLVPDTSNEPRMSTPATRLADSLAAALRAEAAPRLQTDDSAESLEAELDTTGLAAEQESLAQEPVEIDTLSPLQRRIVNRISEIDTILQRLQVDLMSTHLHVAEFFQHTLNEPDSAMVYLELAVDSPINHPNYWRANLQLARMLEAAEPPETDRAQAIYEELLALDTLPYAVRNSVREKLGLARLTKDESAQEIAFDRAEAAFMADILPTESVIELYSQTIALDSTSETALMAFWGLMYLYKHELEDLEQARSIAETIKGLHPDSAFVADLDGQMQEITGEASYFSMTEEEIAALRAQSHETITSQPDSTGWLPPEDELLGRRFR